MMIRDIILVFFSYWLGLFLGYFVLPKLVKRYKELKNV